MANKTKERTKLMSKNDRKLEGKVVVVTGGSRGIGAAIAKRLAADGASVAITYAKNAKAASAVVEAIENDGGKAVAIQADVADTDLNPAAGDWAVPQKAVTALDRFGQVDEVAALVSFVAGPESSYITGASLTVDGGTNA